MSKTPKTDALRLKMAQLGWPPDAEPVATIMLSHSQLESDLDLTQQTGLQIWKANERLKSELAETSKDYRCLAELLDGHDATECRANLVKLKADLQAERELADRLALTLDDIRYYDGLSPGAKQPVREVLAAWKECRRDP